MDAVWLCSTVPEAFEECGLDYRRLWPFVEPEFGAFLLQVAAVAQARDRGIGFIPGGGFVS